TRVEPRAIGQDHARRDGAVKVRGTATYAADAAAHVTPAGHPAYLHLVQAPIGRGRITAVETAEVERLAGVLAVLTPDNAERMASANDRELAVLQDREVAFRGQVVAAVVADTPEVARQGAELLRVSYD